MKDAMATCNRTAPAAGGLRSPVLLGFTDADLKVCDIMTDNVTCAVPGETVLAAVRRMSECRVSCVMVVEGDTVVGILTEREMCSGELPQKVEIPLHRKWRRECPVPWSP